MAGGELNAFFFPVDARQAAQPKLEMVPAGLGQVFNFFRMGIETACGELVQERFPHMGACRIDQGDFGLAAAAPFFPQLCGQSQAASAASHDDNAVHKLFLFWFSIDSEFNAARCQLPE